MRVVETGGPGVGRSSGAAGDFAGAGGGVDLRAPPASASVGSRRRAAAAGRAETALAEARPSVGDRRSPAAGAVADRRTPRRPLRCDDDRSSTRDS